ncbi:MAG: hypothetical protein ACM3NQ_15700 [Bacteroidales bacterium]
MRALLLAGVIALVAPQAVAQTVFTSTPAVERPPLQGQRSARSDDGGLATPTGHQVDFSVSTYTYNEPSSTSISIHGPKIGGEYAGTISLDKDRHWFAQADVRGIAGGVTYDGWCSPFLITPNSASPNGYALDFGAPSPCSETGDRDWYLEARGLVGKDLIRKRWAFSPYAGLGVRHLSNGTTGTPGFRTDDYLYVPLGVTARSRVASHGMLTLTFEYDHLLRGWQTTRNSALGGGDVPATATAPAFTINGISDVSFDQHGGYALRASGKYQATRRWSVEPYYIYWNVDDSPVSYETATFTVNNVTAQQQMGFYEPFNVTHEFGVKLGFHF